MTFLLTCALVASVVAEPVDFSVFWRNQTNAALRVRLCGTEEGAAELSGEIAGERLATRRVSLAADETRLVVPFDPACVKAGTYPWRLQLASSRGARIWEGDGQIEVRPRLEREAFKFLNWGGWKSVPDDYLRAVGINATMVDAFKTDVVRRQVLAGFFPCLRYENMKRYKLGETDFSPQEIQARTHRDFAPYEGLHVWTMTLVNSEVYGSVWGQRATNQPEFVSWARRELGFEPDFRYRNGPIEVNAATVGNLPSGIIRPGDCRQLDTLGWVMACGMTPYRVGRVTAAAIHRLDSGNTVWSEPSFEGVAASLDMLADWHYQYSTAATVRELRADFARCRPYGTPYMPTLSGGYYHGHDRPRFARTGRMKHAVAAQSADEVAIKAYLALAAVPAHNLSFFALDAWSEGERAGLAEPGTGMRFGRIWRERIAPAADLLRDLPNERAPLAVVRPSACRYASGLGWGQVHYPACIESVLARTGLPYDVLYDKELEAGALKGYRYAILPMATTLYARHVAKLEEAAASGCCIVTDAYAAKRFDRGVSLDALTYPHDFRRNGHRIEGALQPWLTSVLPGLRKRLRAWSEGDGETSFTFVKETDGVKYVTVVNDRRRVEPGFLNGCVTNDWYRPYGAPQKIVTHFNVPDESVLYAFDAGEGAAVERTNGDVVLDYGAAEAKIFTVYPRAMSKLLMDVKEGCIRLALVDEARKPAPGRQVVVVEVRDPEGALHDETGRYVMARGRLRIPLRLTHDEVKRASDRRWKIRATELTTGLRAEFSVKENKPKRAVEPNLTGSILTQRSRETEKL